MQVILQIKLKKKTPFFSRIFDEYEVFKLIGAQDRARTGTDHLRWILSPLRLPISPLGRCDNYTQNPSMITM